MAAAPRRRTSELEAQSHFNFRLVEVVMMLMLPLLAVALAVPPKRSSSALGIFVSILIVVAYHKVNQYAAAGRRQGRLDPTLALVAAAPAPLGVDRLDVPCPRPQARRPADRRARMRSSPRLAKRVRALLPKPRKR